MNEIVNELIKNEAFVKKITTCKNAEEFKTVIEQFNIELCESDAETAYAQFVNGCNNSKKANEELEEEELAAVSGGRIRGLFYWIGYGIGKLVNNIIGGCG